MWIDERHGGTGIRPGRPTTTWMYLWRDHRPADAPHGHSHLQRGLAQQLRWIGCTSISWDMPGCRRGCVQSTFSTIAIPSAGTVMFIFFVQV